MIEEENEKIPLCPVCLETLITNLIFASDNHLYHKICFSKLNLKSPISRKDFSYYLTVNKVVKGIVYKSYKSYKRKSMENLLCK